MQSGDEIEILTSKTPQVREEWLSLVKTAKAKAEIKAFIRNSRQKEFEELGRQEIENLAKELNLSINDDLIEKNLQKFNKGKNVTEIYALLAQDKIKKKDFIKILFPDFEKSKTKEDAFDNKRIMKIKMHSTTDQKGIAGLDKNIAYKYAKCCYPVPPEEIVGVVNNGIGITVHRKDCKTLQTIHADRIIDLEWNTGVDTKYVAKINLILDSKPGILAKVVNLCAEKKLNIIGISTVNESDIYQEIELKIEVKDVDELNNFKASSRSIQGVIDIK